MKKIELILNNPFMTKDSRSERTSLLFNRVYRQLTVNKLNPGKVVPIFIKINRDFKIFGAFTLNGGGSVSFFPDFFNLDNFDHLTLSTDFINKKGHLTKIDFDGERSKAMNLEASPLNGSSYYHLITFGMDSSDLLMDPPIQVKLPDISYNTEEERVKYTKWIEESAYRTCTLEFPEENGSYFVQILILPKGKSADNLAVERSFVEKILIDKSSFENKNFNCKKTEISTPEKSDFTINLLTFRVDGKVKGSFCFMMAQDSEKIYNVC